MSKIFYDHLITLSDLEKEMREVVETSEEREELWKLVDEIIHHRVLACIFDHLPEEHHYDFLCKFHKCPHDDRIFQFIDELVEESAEELIIGEIRQIERELLEELLI